MGLRELAGAHIGADGEVLGLDMDIPEPGITAAEMMTFILAAQEQLAEMWRIAQRELDRQGALLR
jgi:hypothetical protein